MLSLRGAVSNLLVFHPHGENDLHFKCSSWIPIAAMYETGMQTNLFCNHCLTFFFFKKFLFKSCFMTKYSFSHINFVFFG